VGILQNDRLQNLPQSCYLSFCQLYDNDYSLIINIYFHETFSTLNSNI
jgi:hypothetical protein